MNTIKLQEAILCICNSVQDKTHLGAVKLNKILWKSDVESYITTGKSITNSVYTKQALGPIPKHLPSAKNS